jgi:hypothetical protein
MRWFSFQHLDLHVPCQTVSMRKHYSLVCSHDVNKRMRMLEVVCVLCRSISSQWILMRFDSEHVSRGVSDTVRNIRGG